MINKRYELRGLDLRSSDINRPINKASDCQNVQLNQKGELVKRFGFDGIISGEIVDIFEYKKMNRLIVQKADGFYYVKDDSLIAINFSTGVIPDMSNKFSIGEYNGVIYLADPNGNNELYKYDGCTIYRAGVPRPIMNITAGAGSYSYRVYLRFRDRQGNITSGDYQQFDDRADGAFFEAYQPKQGFYEKYGEINVPLGFLVGLGESDTITVQPGHNYIVGDCLYITGDQRADYDDVAEFFEIIEVTATTLRLDISKSKASFLLTAGEPVERRWGVIVSQSLNKSYGYMVSDFRIQDQNGLNKYPDSVQNVTVPGGYAQLALSLEDVYDPTILKGLPPKCKYVDFYNNIMILGNSVVNSETNNFVRTEAQSTIFWSDTGVGSTVETFPPFNLYPIGRSSEGEITGLFGSSDNVKILKERQVYYLNGNLVLNSYRARSSMSNGVGCIAHRSILEVEGGCIFMSTRGLYLCAFGNKPVELSQEIEPIFTDNPYELDLSSATTVNDIDGERLYIHISPLPDSETEDGITLEYDYAFKEWFLHRGILGSSGMAFVNGELYHANQDSLYRRSSEYNDDSSAIVAYWKSTWENLGMPSVVKKFVKFVMLSISSMAWTLNLRTQDDWNPGNEKTNQEIDIEPYSTTALSIDMTQKKSMRVEIRNDVNNEGMLVTGYEFISEETQERFKGDK